MFAFLMDYLERKARLLGVLELSMYISHFSLIMLGVADLLLVHYISLGSYNMKIDYFVNLKINNFKVFIKNEKQIY